MKRALCTFTTYISYQYQKHTMVSIQESSNLISNFKDWKFKTPPNYSELPIDENPEYNIPMAVNNAIFSKVPTEGLNGNLKLVCASDSALAEILDLEPAVAETEHFVHFVAGRYLPEGGMTVCHRYGGHQFGFWADQLGDGRAHVLGEYVNRRGESWQPQLKGSGETPYSRFGDGRAVLRSSLREMVGSEAAAGLGIASTRAAALVVSDSHRVLRDPQYDGHARWERAACVLRLARCWARIGSLEILQRRNEPQLLKTFLDFLIKHHFPSISLSDEDRLVQLYSAVSRANLDLVSSWQAMGFVHGVLNTDNVSLLGDTLDYGPYGYLDRYTPHVTFNGSDDRGRYLYSNQPQMMLWNLEKLSQAMEPALSAEQVRKVAEIRGQLQEYVTDRILGRFVRKLGLREARAGHAPLVERLLALMADSGADFTATFRQLSHVECSRVTELRPGDACWSLVRLSALGERWQGWLHDYCDMLDSERVRPAERRGRMLAHNPAYVPRGWMLSEAIADAELDNFDKVRFLLKIVQKPFEENPEAEARGFSAPPPRASPGDCLTCCS